MSDTPKILYRFPLPCLTYGPDPVERLHATVDYCCVELGAERVKRLTKEQIEDIICDQEDKGHPECFDDGREIHVWAVVGQNALKVQGGSMRTILPHHAEVNSYLNQFTSKHGKQPYVSIWHKLVWEVINKSGMSWRELSVLCGLYSWIGKRRKAYVARSVIQCRALGYKSAAVMGAELANRTDGEKPLTIRQINYTLDRLHERQFFARVRKDPWHTYYSVSVPQDALEKAILDSVSYEAGFHQRRVARTSDFMAKIRAARGAANVDTANVNNPASDCPRSVHVESTEVSTPVSTECPRSVHITKPFLLNPCTEPFPSNPSQETTHTLSLSVCVPEQEQEEPKEQVPVITPSLQPPTLAEVEAFFESLRKNGSERAGEWFEDFGSDTAWTSTDWKKPAAKWALDRRRRRSTA